MQKSLIQKEALSGKGSGYVGNHLLALLVYHAIIRPGMSFLGHRKDWLMSQMASCIHLAPLLSRFWDVWVALWGNEQDSSMDSSMGPSPMVMSVLSREDQK